MRNKEEIIKYIENEKLISKYKISSIDSSRFSTPSSRRLLEIEKQFVLFPFEDMFFNSISEVAAAISLYRTSRYLFLRTYGFEESQDKKQSSIIQQVNSSILFSAFSELKSKIELLNQIKEKHSEDFIQSLSYADLKIYQKRKKAIVKRFQVFISCAQQHLASELEFLCEHPISKGINFEQRIISGEVTESSLEACFQGLSKIKKETRTQSACLFNSLDKRKRIGNILAQPSFLINVSEKDVLRFSIEKDKRRNIKRRSIGINLNLETKGNEKTFPVAVRIKIRGRDISELFCPIISNVKIHGKYTRTFMLKPLTQFSEDDFLSLEKMLQGELNELSKDRLAQILNTVNIQLDEDSFLFIPLSRRECEYLSIARQWFDFELKNIDL
jgi:hypothetical protein